MDLQVNDGRCAYNRRGVDADMCISLPDLALHAVSFALGTL